MTMSSKKSSNCGRSSLKFLPVSRRPFGVESDSRSAFGEESWADTVFADSLAGSGPKSDRKDLYMLAAATLVIFNWHVTGRGLVKARYRIALLPNLAKLSDLSLPCPM